ncbi:CS1 type fimbrial major subunit [Pseudomonas sp. Kh13]|uniref:CS1 type fimbrial major subunit n=1 Tax=Pseudomonas sp. Kh13 TaxID=2093744 RepID=UPI001183F7E9|nr:CS1 type fimbrial major subunit [Pseudomonas sp. Kh13]
MKAAYLAIPFLAFVAGSAVADDAIEKQVQITATVPTANFYVEPVGGNWMNEPQEMAWNSFQGTLEPVRKQLQAKSTVGPITAHLLYPAAVTSGLDAIDLDVKVGTTVLTTKSAEVIDAAQAGAGALVDFEVAPKQPAGGYKPGSYQGLVSMMFETAAP